MLIQLPEAHVMRFITVASYCAAVPDCWPRSRPWRDPCSELRSLLATAAQLGLAPEDVDVEVAIAGGDWDRAAQELPFRRNAQALPGDEEELLSGGGGGISHAQDDTAVWEQGGAAPTAQRVSSPPPPSAALLSPAAPQPGHVDWRHSPEVPQEGGWGAAGEGGGWVAGPATSWEPVQALEPPAAPAQAASALPVFIKAMPAAAAAAAAADAAAHSDAGNGGGGGIVAGEEEDEMSAMLAMLGVGG